MPRADRPRRARSRAALSARPQRDRLHPECSVNEFEPTLRALLADGHGARFRVEGDSMHPVIRGGEYAHVIPCAVSELRRGNVILASTGRGLTAHRIVRIEGQRIITRGDNSLRADPPVEA